MKNIKTPNGSPTKIKRGSVTVKIYHNRNRGRECFTVAYCDNGRKRQVFSKFDEAKLAAERIAAQIASGEVQSARLTSADCACFWRAKQLADSINLPLESLAAQFVEATVSLGSVSWRDAIAYFLKKHPPNSKPHLIQDVITEMLEAKRRDGLSPKYILHLGYDMKKFATSFNCNIASVTGAEIDAWLHSLGVAPRTRNNLRTAVQTLFSFAIQKRYLPKDHDELELVPLAKEKGRDIEVFAPAELEEILHHSDNRVLAVLVLGALAGIRHAEAQRLDWRDVHLEENLIEIKADNAKTASRRTVPISDNLRSWLSATADCRSSPALVPRCFAELPSLHRTSSSLQRRFGGSSAFVSGDFAARFDFKSCLSCAHATV